MSRSRREGLVEPVVLVRAVHERAHEYDRLDDLSCIITSKQTVNMPVVEVKFGNDDNEVQGDTLLGGTCPSRSKPTARDHGTSNWTRRN